MQSIQGLLSSVSRLTGRRFSEDDFRKAQGSVADVMARKIERFNAEVGRLNLEDGYNCDKCNNRGYIGRILMRNGCLYEQYPECSCMAIRRSVMRMKASGLENAIRQQRFDNFETKEPFQQRMVEVAKAYATGGAKEGKWFFIGGAVGCGKTHICTAICRALLMTSPVHYMPWQTESTELKALVNDEEEYSRKLNRLKTVEVLYIDDFFKPVNGAPPTQADVKLAYDVINYRYINRLATIISSERVLDELLDIDEATASRIAERSKGYFLTIGRAKGRNYRLGGGMVL